MPQRILYPQWREEHGGTKYPFGDSASLANDEGYTLLEGTFLDAALFPIGASDGLHLSKVVVEHDRVTIYVGDRRDKELASAEFDLITPPDNLDLSDAFGRPAGVLVSSSDRLGVFQSWEVGEHTFKTDQTQFAATVCFPTPEVGVRGILLEDGTLMTGDVWIVGDDGVVVTASDEGVMRLDVVGDPLFRRRLCEDAGLFTTPSFITSIRVLHSEGEFVVTPNERGNVSITAHNGLKTDTALRVRTTDVLKIEIAGGRSGF
jgi:hypothetical protein